MENEFVIPSDINQNKIIVKPITQDRVLSVGLYVGLGAGESGVLNVKNNLQNNDHIKLIELTSEYIVEQDLSIFDVIIFPGGRAGKQAGGLGEQGKEKIKSFVRQGGGYLGICAGMYLATSGFDWSLHILNAVVATEKDEWRRGKGFVDIEITEEGKEILGDIDKVFKCRYSNGPLIKRGTSDSLKSYTTAAYFRSEISENGTPSGIMMDTPAAVFSMLGKGKVFVTSVHPENTPGLENCIPRILNWLSN
jgi:hypothetical protein